MASNDEGNVGAQVDNRLDDLFGDANDGGADFQSQESGEVNDRLDEFFGDENPPLEDTAKKSEKPNPKPAQAKSAPKKPKPSKPKYNAENSELKELKSIVLQLEWEITDEVMNQLIEESGKLEAKFKSDKILVAFFQLLSSLGKYIMKKKAGAHPDSIALLNSVYEKVEEVMLNKDLSEADKKKILVTEVNKYKDLKKSIAAMPVKAKKPPETPRPKEEAYEEEHESAYEEESREAAYEEEPSAESGALKSGDVVKAIERLNQTIKTEFQALREEIQRWMEQR